MHGALSDVAARYAGVADAFGARVVAVPDAGWDAPAPCEGWVARDVVGHLTEWVPGFFGHFAGVELERGPSADEDPAAAWEALDRSLRAALADPAVAGRTFEVHGQEHTFDSAVAQFVVGDVLVHTWDLARATGQDETLDPDEVHRMLVGIEPMGDALAKSGHYGLPVVLDAGADEQSRLLAATGRRP